MRIKWGTLVAICLLMMACGKKDNESQTSSLAEKVQGAVSLSFEGNSVYSDGGSIAYIFKSDTGSQLILILQVEFDEFGAPMTISNSTQIIYLTNNSRHSREDSVTLERYSCLEAKLLELLNDEMVRSDVKTRKIIQNLIRVIKSRNFDWKQMFKPEAGGVKT